MLSLEALYFTWSDFLRESSQPEAARQHAGRAVDLAEGLLQREPRHAIARAQAREAHLKRALAHEALERWADAVKDWDRVVELDEKPDAWKRRLLRTRAVFRKLVADFQKTKTR